MKNTLLLSLLLLCSTNIWAQKKSKFNTMDKGKSKHEKEWSGSLSYGNTEFLGDLSHQSEENYLPNLALSVKFNKEFNKKKGFQFAVTAGKNSGESDFELPIANRFFRSQYLQSQLVYRVAISPAKNNKTGNAKPQVHLVFGAGYYLSKAKLFDPNLSIHNPIRSENISSLVFPAGIELSYYIKSTWGAMLSINNNTYLSDDIDLYEVESNGPDNQLFINLGLCYKFN